MKPPSNKIIVIVGPTASGKTGLAISLAKKFGGEIISADSRQVYRGMDIGTGKDLREYRAAKVPHHLIDIASPKRQYTVADWQAAARRVIDDVLRRGRLPIVCGGTGLYVSALLDGYQLPAGKSSATELRAIRKRLSVLSLPQLLARLKKIDPTTHQTIDRQNRRRVERALEIYYTTGKPKSAQLKKQPAAYASVILHLNPDRATLQQRIVARLRVRLQQGMIAEVRRLRAAGVSWRRLADFGLEYRWVANHLQGKVSREELIAGLERDIIKYAKRQETWFKRLAGRQDVTSPAQAIVIVKKFLR